MTLRINADFTQRATIKPVDFQWVPSPMPGVERMMLDRIGDEVARATSLVRYAPNSTFSPHTHGGGEEYFVLEGVFADEHGEYPAGTYARNPIGTSHTPRIGSEGALIFVKLHQFSSEDRAQFTLDTRSGAWQTVQNQGVETMPLHQFGSEKVALLRLAPHSVYSSDLASPGHECLLLSGEVEDMKDSYPAGSWVRTPPGQRAEFHTKETGAVMLVKSGHLPAS